MGLDCYVNVATESETVEIWYGRKENEIHGWMQTKSGIPADDFNCVELPLTHSLINEFEKDMLAGKLTPTSGFFFGAPSTPEQLNEATNSLITVVRTALDTGSKPYYTSWW